MKKVLLFLILFMFPVIVFGRCYDIPFCLGGSQTTRKVCDYDDAFVYMSIETATHSETKSNTYTVDADANGVDIHFGDKMVSDLLNDETITLVNADGESVDFKGSLSENGMVYTLDATLADGFYTLTVADDVKNVLGVPMQADFTCELAVGDVYGIKTADGADVEAIAANTTYVVTEPVSGNNARMAIVGIYNSSNMLVASAIENITADYAKKYAEVEITTPETLAEGEYYVRYFLWDASTLMPALSESIKVFE